MKERILEVEGEEHVPGVRANYNVDKFILIVFFRFTISSNINLLCIFYPSQREQRCDVVVLPSVTI